MVLRLAYMNGSNCISKGIETFKNKIQYLLSLSLSSRTGQGQTEKEKNKIFGSGIISAPTGLEHS